MFNAKYIAKFTMIAFLSFAMMSCTKQEGSTFIGAIGGALVVSALTNDSSIGVALGTLAGAYIGNDIGKKLSEADHEKMYRSTQGALETGTSGTSSQWYNPVSGNSGSVTPQPSYENTGGQYCREYQQTVTIGGEVETAYGTACRQPDGTWKITNS